MSLNNNQHKSYLVLLVGLVVGVAISFVINLFTQQVQPSKESEPKPLYWVAPMDSNYIRDKPGKSPMGMDLIPVYEEASNGNFSGPGVVKISPEVVNNLGVRVVEAKYAPLQDKIATVGYVKYDEDQLIHIHPRVEGWIEKLYVKAAGDPVEEGQPLYEIYSPALVNTQEELLLALDRKNKRLINAAENRLKALQLPQVIIERLKKTKSVQQNITFYAPQKGVIDNLNIREGFFVKPGTTLMSIGRLEQVWVEAEVFERQASAVAVGIPVTMSLDYLPGKEWQGKVDYVYPTLNAKTRTVKVRLRFDNQSRELKPNMFAQVVIYPQSKHPSLLIPKEAVIRSGNTERVVLALGEGRFKSINIKTGRFGKDFVEILSGLNVGEKVVSSAHFLLDSESSKSSDFKRMTQVSTKKANMGMHQENTQNESTITVINETNSATVDGVINLVMSDHRMLNISREAIKKWGREAATLDFWVEENIDLSSLKKGMKIRFSFYLLDGKFTINNILLESQEVKSAGEKHD